MRSACPRGRVIRAMVGTEPILSLCGPLTPAAGHRVMAWDSIEQPLLNEANRSNREILWEHLLPSSGPYGVTMHVQCQAKETAA
eukprot:5633622-Amphidinium_carterae.2